MAAEERPPGTSCSHALRDSQDPPPRVSLLGDPGGELVEGERAGVCKAQVERRREPRGFSNTRLAWQQVQLQPRLLWDVLLNGPLF